MTPLKAVSQLSSGLTQSQKKLVGAIKDPEQRSMQVLQCQEQNKALVATTITNVLMMQHQACMAPANNLKS